MTDYVGGASSSNPYSGVCYIVADFGGGNLFGATGFMVGPNDVLTASHLIYDVTLGGVASSVTVYPAYDGGAKPYGEHVAATIDYFPVDEDGNGQLFKSDSLNDFALLGLTSRVGDATGTFALDPFGGTRDYNFTGYPAAYRISNDARMVTDSGVASADAQSAVFNYVSIETNPGNSGSPLWYTAADGSAVAVGVASTSNWAVGISAQYDLITQWIAGNDHLIPSATVTPQGDAPTTVTIAPGAVAAAFDEAWYLTQNADVAAAKIDALAHYLSNGWREGRDPSAVFDVNGYRAVYADVGASDIDPLTHYQRYGQTEGRDPSTRFDTTSYLEANPDIAGFADGPLAHYIQFGADEGREISASEDPAWQAVA